MTKIVTVSKTLYFVAPKTRNYKPEPKSTAEAFHHARNCDLLIVIGSSLVVQPAASIPLEAKEGGAKLVIINRDPTSYDSYADVVIHDSAGDVMNRILEGLETV